VQRNQQSNPAQQHADRNPELYVRKNRSNHPYRLISNPTAVSGASHLLQKQRNSAPELRNQSRSATLATGQ
jgi:hypothetical protein